MDSHDDYERLAGLARRRREELDLTQLEVATEGGISLDRVSAVERGTASNLSPKTVRGLERGLRWEPRSVRSVLDGGDPTPQRRDVPVGTATARAGAGSIGARTEVRGAGHADPPADMPQRRRGESSRAWYLRVLEWHRQEMERLDADDPRPELVADMIVGGERMRRERDAG